MKGQHYKLNEKMGLERCFIIALIAGGVIGTHQHRKQYGSNLNTLSWLEIGETRMNTKNWQGAGQLLMFR